MANRISYLPTVAAALILSAMASTASLAADKSDTGKGSGQSADHSMQMHQMMQQGSQEMQGMPMTGDMDKDFAMMMRHHHQQGVKMAQMELEHGKDPQMKAMAKKIMASQQEEIKKFDQWLKGKGK
jgi:uncharacterized protein (DUF305 family)